MTTAPEAAVAKGARYILLLRVRVVEPGGLEARVQVLEMAVHRADRRSGVEVTRENDGRAARDLLLHPCEQHLDLA